MLALISVIIGITLGICQLYFPPQVIRRSNVATDLGCTFNVSIGASKELSIVPLQFVTPTAIAFWSDGTWDRFLSENRKPELTEIQSGKATTRPLPAAA